MWLSKSKWCSQQRSVLKEKNECGELQPFSLKGNYFQFFLEWFLLLFFFSARLFRTLVNQFRHAMTVTVVYKSPFPWTVSACLLWDETTAIRSSARQIPAFSALLFSQNPPRLTIERFSGAAHTIWFVFRQSTDSDNALLMLIKDDAKWDLHNPNAKRWLNVGCIRQMPFVKQILLEKILLVSLPSIKN